MFSIDHKQSSIVSAASNKEIVHKEHIVHQTEEFVDSMDRLGFSPPQNPVAFIIDSGVANIPERGLNVIQSLPEGQVNADHGTAVASVLIRHAPPNTKIISYTALDRDLRGTWYSVAAGMDAAALLADEIDVVNISIGGGLKSTDPLAIRIREAAEYLMSKNVAVFASSGNSGFKNKEEYPANLSSIASVSAASITVDGRASVAAYSNYDEDTEVSAIGNVYTVTKNGTASFSTGTSFASPIVSGNWLYYTDVLNSPFEYYELLKRTGLTLNALPVELRMCNKFLQKDALFNEYILSTLPYSTHVPFIA